MKSWCFSFALLAAFALPAAGAALTPEEGLKSLQEGNQRYVNESLIHPNRGSERRAELSSKQKPFAVIVACADSRVSPEIVFDQGIGDLFVVRVAGNVVGPLELESINYAVSVLNASLIVVLGHEACGAVQATLSGNAKIIESVATLIEPAVKGIDKTSQDALQRATKQNARLVADYIKGTPLISKMINDKKVQVTTGYLELKEGSVVWGF